MTDLPRCPILLEWKPGGERPVLAADEIGVWLVELDAGLRTKPRSTGPSQGLSLRCSTPKSERVRRGLSGRATAGGSPVAAPPCERSWGVAGRAAGLAPVSGGGSRQARAGFPADRRRPAALRFNLSHSSDLALIAVCRGRELGVDLEQIRPIGEAERIVESFFSEAEQAEFAAIAAEARPLAFLRGWTRKEAILKGLGVGIAGLADRHETGFGTRRADRPVLSGGPVSAWAQWQLWEASPRPASWRPWPARLAERQSTGTLRRERPTERREIAPSPDSGGGTPYTEDGRNAARNQLAKSREAREPRSIPWNF